MVMRVLLDENLPRKLKWRLKEVEAVTVPEIGWSGMKNGKLLHLVEQEFDVLMMMDRSLEYQQNMEKINMGIMLLSAPSNDYDDLMPLVPKINKQLKHIRSGEIVKVEE
jgi:hypothetical protein